jgi:FkbM family methyltransferase
VNDLRSRRARGPAWLRRILGHPRIVPATALLLRARTVRPSSAFVARELFRRAGSFVYRERSGGLSVVVRHGSADPVTLGEVFHERDYEPPLEMPPLRPARVVDLGANVGYFGAFALATWPEAHVAAWEPDPANAEIHARTIAINGLEARWELHRSAASNAAGSMRFSATADALSHQDDSGELVVPSEDVLPAIAGVELLKMDIEGGEWAILGDPRFADDPPQVVVMEHHPNGAPGPDSRAAALEALGAAGLTSTASIFLRADGYGMLWAWRP